MRKFLTELLILFIILVFNPDIANCEIKVKIRDIATIAGIRDNQLIGYGLIVGLAGTGDSGKLAITTRMAANMFEKFGMEVDAKQLSSKNVGAVIVTANLPPFATPGEKIDVTVSSIGDAKSLAGGVLLQTPLKASDDEIYAVAQGNVVLSISEETGRKKSSLQSKTVGYIPTGALIEKAITSDFVIDNKITLILGFQDFSTASEIAKAILEKYPDSEAKAKDSASVVLSVPAEFKDKVVEFISELGKIEIVPEAISRVVIDSKTGTIIMGGDIKLSSVAISHGNLTVTVKSGEGGEEKKESFLSIEESADVKGIVDGLNSIGATVLETIAILQALKSAGALHAQLIVK